ncbi:MAG: hypothetical protein QM773_01110 [Hyphomonadaceae bacterium]
MAELVAIKRDDDRRIGFDFRTSPWRHHQTEPTSVRAMKNLAYLSGNSAGVLQAVRAHWAGIESTFVMTLNKTKVGWRGMLMIPDVLQGLYARRDALEQKLGEAIVTMSRVASACADAQDDETASIIEGIAFKLQGVKTQIAAYEAHAMGVQARQADTSRVGGRRRKARYGAFSGPAQAIV